jgi:hypothetical protein
MPAPDRMAEGLKIAERLVRTARIDCPALIAGNTRPRGVERGINRGAMARATSAWATRASRAVGKRLTAVT